MGLQGGAQHALQAQRRLGRDEPRGADQAGVVVEDREADCLDRPAGRPDADGAVQRVGGPQVVGGIGLKAPEHPRRAGRGLPGRADPCEVTLDRPDRRRDIRAVHTGEDPRDLCPRPLRLLAA